MVEFYMVFGAIYQDTFFNSKIFIFHSTLIYISFYPLASKTRIGAVELLVRKYLLLWWSFCVLKVTIYNLI